MIIGMSVSAFTQIHVLLSLIGIVSGFAVLAGLWSARLLPGLTVVYLATTVATSATGFLFHSTAFGPPHVVGVLSLVVLALTIIARYQYKLAGAARPVYVVGAVFALYLNVFVAVVQAFQKLPFLHPLAPTGSEPPFAIAQAVVLVLFIAGGYRAVRMFRPSL